MKIFRKRYIVNQQKPVFTATLSPGLLAGSLLVACLCAVRYPAAAQPAPPQPSAVSGQEAPVKKPHSSGDSLRQAIERLRAEAGKLRAEADEINESVRHLEVRVERGERPPTRYKDTVQLLSSEGTNAFLETLRGKKRGARERGYGGGLGPTPGIFLVNMRPVNELLDVIRSGNDFSNISFPVEGTWENFFLMGITGYGALGSGLRIGGCFRGGSRSYSTHYNDSTFSIEVSSRFGGLLIEKAMVSGSMNWFLGGMVGGSSLEVTPSKVSNFVSSIPTHTGEIVPRTYTTLSAPALLVELHGGFTYTMTRWFHVGLDLATPLFFAPSGFRTPSEQSITNGFITINPGLRIRIILGNIG